MPDDKPLPVSFWGDTTPEDQEPQMTEAQRRIIDATFADMTKSVMAQHTKNVEKFASETVTALEELESWRPSFESIGTTVEAAMHSCYGLPNYDGIVMRTYEQVFDYLRKRENAPDAVAPKQELQPNTKRQANKDKKQKIADAQLAWKTAVAQQQQAMMQWKQYVNTLHQAYNDAKNGI